MVTLQRRTGNDDLELPAKIPPLLQRIYRQRNIQKAEELNLGLVNLLGPDSMRGLDAAVNLLVTALQQQQRILFVADFDADGATSCALGLSALAQMGASHVDYIVPNRFDYGYGLTPEIVELAIQKEPDLIITVDNGISSIEGVTCAQQAGIKVLVTDHHLAPAQLPDADAIVNPNQPGCDFPSKSIAGVGVIFYVLSALRAKLRADNWFVEQGLAEPNMAGYLDLVALGTVADVVPLDRNNRILVDEGLRRIRAGQSRPGITALLRVAKRDSRQLNSTDLGFGLGPRLNAAGRLDDMSTGIECLLAGDDGTAYQYALQLDGMNRDRRQIEKEMADQAFAALRELHLDADSLPPAICVYDSRWHQGVVGILASRIKENFNRPVIAFANASDADDAELKGSARSIKGFHIRDVLDAIATKNPGLISKFGGHAMAAGLSLQKDKLDEFERGFQAEAALHLTAAQLQAVVESDGPVAVDDFNLETAQSVRFGGPWGQEFPEPLFDDRFLVREQRRVGENHLKMTLSPMNNQQYLVDAIAFNVDETDWPAADCQEMHLAFRLDINEFRGQRSVQLLVDHIIEVV